MNITFIFPPSRQILFKNCDDTLIEILKSAMHTANEFYVGVCMDRQKARVSISSDVLLNMSKVNNTLEQLYSGREATIGVEMLSTVDMIALREYMKDHLVSAVSKMIPESVPQGIVFCAKMIKYLNDTTKDEGREF